MIREAPTANRYVEEAENERQYQKHVNAIKNMKPSINTHGEVKNKDKKQRNPRIRIFNGQNALNNVNQPMATTGLRKEKTSEKLERRPKTAMNYIDLEFNIENDNENEVFSARKLKTTIDTDSCDISENSSGMLETSSKKKRNINDNNGPDKKDITEFDIFSINSVKSQAEKEREELTTNLYHPYIPTNSARAKVKTTKPEIQNHTAKKSRIPLSRQDTNGNSNTNSTGQAVKKISSTGSIQKNTVPNTKSKVRVKPTVGRDNNMNINSNNDDTDNSTTTSATFKPQKVTSARRKAKNDTSNHPHMNQMDKQQIQAQQRQQQRILKQQQEKLERQERLEKLEKQKKKISTNPSSSQLPSSPSSPVINKNNSNKILKSPGSNSSLANKKQTNKNNDNTKRFFQTEISLSKTKNKIQQEERLCKTDQSNDDMLLPCQPFQAESSPKVTFGADMWDTSDDEDEDETENLTTDEEKGNVNQFETEQDKNDSSNLVDVSDKNILSDIESDNGIDNDFVCSDDFSSDNDF